MLLPQSPRTSVKVSLIFGLVLLVWCIKCTTVISKKKYGTYTVPIMGREGLTHLSVEYIAYGMMILTWNNDIFLSEGTK